MGSYYGIFIPAMFVFILPYVLLLALLYCLGKMSRHQEIVAMIQTGRGVFRIVMPLLVTGVISSAICLIFNYHWGPWAEGNKDLIVDMAKDGEADRARSVLYRDKQSRRVWLVGSFPYQFEKTGTLRNVTVHSFNDGNHPTTKLEAETAVWSRAHKNWTFSGLQLIDLQAVPFRSRSRPRTASPATGRKHHGKSSNPASTKVTSASPSSTAGSRPTRVWNGPTAYPT